MSFSEIRLHHVPLTLQYVYGCSDVRGENVDKEEGRECRLLELLLEMTWFCVASGKRT